MAKHGLKGKIKISYILVSKREKKRLERERKERERKEEEEEEEGGAKIKQSQAPKRYGTTNLEYGTWIFGMDLWFCLVNGLPQT